jgi:TPR repeat protein
LLGRCHEQGWGTVQDPATAAEWYRRSAEGGYFRGQFNWASVLLARGQAGEAAAWFERAGTQGSPGVRQAAIDLMARARGHSPQLDQVWRTLRRQS